MQFIKAIEKKKKSLGYKKVKTRFRNPTKVQENTFTTGKFTFTSRMIPKEKSNTREHVLDHQNFTQTLIEVIFL